MCVTCRVILGVLLIGALIPLGADIVNLGGQYCVTPEGQAGLCTSVAGATTIDFDGMAAVPPSSPYVSGIATYTWSGGDPFVIGSLPGNWAAPGATSLDPQKVDETSYLTLGSPGRTGAVSIDFSVPINYFGFYMGSPDRFNLVALQKGQVVSQFSGNQLIDPAGGSWETGEFVNIYAIFSWDKVIMSSGGIAFETDNHAYVAAVPEPASIVGLGTLLLFVGARLRRKRA